MQSICTTISLFQHSIISINNYRSYGNAFMIYSCVLYCPCHVWYIWCFSIFQWNSLLLCLIPFLSSFYKNFGNIDNREKLSTVYPIKAKTIFIPDPIHKIFLLQNWRLRQRSTTNYNDFDIIFWFVCDKSDIF